VPATSASLSRLLTVLMKQTRQAVHAFKKSKLLRCLWFVELQYPIGENLKVVWPKFSTLSLAVLLNGVMRAWHMRSNF
jgi:hypothetical protein